MVTRENKANNEKGSPHSGGPAQNNGKEKHKPETKASKPTAEKAGEELSEELSEELEGLDELAKALAEVNELRDRHLRLKAEWDNYRKRTDAERADERSRATQGLVEKLLPIMDDLERAIDHVGTPDEESFKDGVSQVYSKVQEVLASEGVKVIDPVGEPFDANIHCAISKVEDDSVPEETVVEVFQKGYEMGSRILRPAMVIVSSK